MQNIPTPTTRTRTFKSYETGEQATERVTDWTVGAYTLRKTEEPGYLHWGVVTADRDLPAIFEVATYGAKTPEFGVNWSACGTKPSADARAYAALLATAADVADLFNRIVADN